MVVELFTSEGCSSCPPADQLVARLEREQPVAQADIVILGEHVDYWNQLGWPDRFAAGAFTARQQRYARALASDDVYTPQLVVDGQVGFSGSDAARAVREIRRAAGMPHASLSARRSGDNVTLTTQQFPPGTKSVEIFLAITEDALSSEVRRGENAGRRLSHAGVVRSLLSVAKFDARKSPAFSTDIPLHLLDEWNRANLHAIVFAQDRDSMRILGTASLRL